ncbi:MAG: UDP-N-acetylmuramoyl-tripeptide--D-alanyl-D-alanine ligase [bacterium]|nr:UDP-N-acetylmuramoyl-tripeptide--D-alanyl-D-alanine ligase [bacterium]
MKFFLKQIVITLLTWEARVVLKKYKPSIIAVTGTVGKTSTKDMIYTIFSKYLYTRKSEKSFNGDIGVPLTILGLPNGWNNPFVWLLNILRGLRLIFPVRLSLKATRYPQWLILEIGADRPGDIRRLAKWIKPDVTVVTKLSKVPVHIEFFKSVAEVNKEKSNIVKSLKNGGSLILNGDDEDVRQFSEIRREIKPLFFGFDNFSNIKASNYAIEYEDKNGLRLPWGISFKLNFSNNCLPVKLNGVLGKSVCFAALSGFATAIVADIPPLSALEAMADYKTPPGRMRLVEGVKDSLIIDDTYNSSPAAVEGALGTLRDIEGYGKKIAVLGDMLELGRHSPEAHREIGKLVACSAHVLITVGVRAREIAQVAMENGMSEKSIFQFEDADKAGKHLELLLQKGDIALVKGSQSVRMERTVKEVMARPEDAAKILCRQERQWMLR